MPQKLEIVTRDRDDGFHKAKIRCFGTHGRGKGLLGTFATQGSFEDQLPQGILGMRDGLCFFEYAEGTEQRPQRC